MRIKKRHFINFGRQATSFLRPLPDFVVIGTQKSGTTSLYQYLNQHSKIKMALEKETHYFDLNYEKGTKWYRSLFPIVNKEKKGVIVGDNTPNYFFHPHVPERIHKLLPDAKLIVLLRNPTERAISNYFHDVKKKREKLSIMEALLAEDERTKDEYEKMKNDKNYNSYNAINFSYKARGIYIEQLKRYEKYFSKNNILVLSSEELFSNPNEIMLKIYKFLGLDVSTEKIDFTPHNIGIKKGKVSDEVFEYLNKFYAKYNQDLYEHIGMDFGW